MSIKIKTPEQIAIMKQGGQKLSSVLSELMKECQPGSHTEELDKLARKLILQAGGTPSFLDYKIHSYDTPYPSAVCISLNDEIVHGPATPDRVIKDGDVVKLDLGMWYQGMATDMAATVCVGNAKSEAQELSRHTLESLKRSLKPIRAGAWLHEIGSVIEDYLKPYKYGIVRELVGHGVGYAVHEDPQIPHYREHGSSPVKLKIGMCLAIEPMVALGTWRITQKPDGWTLATADGSLAAHWEVTIAVTDTGFELLTPWVNV